MSVIFLRYKGMICFGETDYDRGSGSDEIYCITNITTNEGGRSAVRTNFFGVYDDVDQGGSFPETKIMYIGQPRDMSMTVSCMEHDYGDPDALYDQSHAVAQAAAAAAKGAGYPVPDWAPGLLANVASVLFGTGDDDLGSQSVVLTADRLSQLANENWQEEQGIQYNFWTMHTGEGSTYKFYFDVMPS